MSKATLALIAAAGAATGAVTTALYYSSKARAGADTGADGAPLHPPPATTTTTTLPAPPSALPLRTGAPTPPVDPSGIFQYGFPGPTNDLATRRSLVSSFDRRQRNPHWVAEHITAASLEARHGDRRLSAFAEDETVPDQFRAKLKDYARSGYDRGHQVPAADAQWEQQAMDETFVLSNMCPQVGDGFNRDYWAHLEHFCRRLTRAYPSVRVVTGPLYLPRRDAVSGKWVVSYEVIGSPPNVAVPTHFYKVVFAEDGRTGGNVALGAFVLPNAEIANETPLVDFEVPLEAVERASGLEFAQKLPAERRTRLCAEVACGVLVRGFAERQRDRLPGPGRGAAPRPGR
ncbi:MAG: nuclease [Phylliscum demangeonii]|nr:MAG: nuclease [Phylliscum demangeonii]